MFDPLINLLVRIAIGERLEKAKPDDYRLWGGLLLFLPIGLLFYPLFGKVFEANGLILWASLVGFGLVCFAGFCWFKRQPWRLMLLLGVPAWTVALVVWIRAMMVSF